MIVWNKIFWPWKWQKKIFWPDWKTQAPPWKSNGRSLNRCLVKCDQWSTGHIIICSISIMSCKHTCLGHTLAQLLLCKQLTGLCSVFCWNNWSLESETSGHSKWLNCSYLLSQFKQWHWFIITDTLEWCYTLELGMVHMLDYEDTCVTNLGLYGQLSHTILKIIPRSGIIINYCPASAGNIIYILHNGI